MAKVYLCKKACSTRLRPEPIKDSFSSIVHLVRCFFILALATCLPFHAQAQIVENLIQINSAPNRLNSLSDLGPNLLGDSIDTESGSLMINHTDIDIPGNSALKVQFSRFRDVGSRMAFDGGAPLIDWGIGIPHIKFRLRRNSDVSSDFCKNGGDQSILMRVTRPQRASCWRSKTTWRTEQ